MQWLHIIDNLLKTSDPKKETTVLPPGMLGAAEDRGRLAEPSCPPSCQRATQQEARGWVRRAEILHWLRARKISALAAEVQDTTAHSMTTLLPSNWGDFVLKNRLKCSPCLVVRLSFPFLTPPLVVVFFLNFVSYFFAFFFHFLYSFLRQKPVKTLHGLNLQESEDSAEEN